MLVSELIDAALREIGALHRGENATAQEAADALVLLNDMLSAWESKGVYVAQFSATSDTISDDGVYRRAMRFNLAVELAPQFNRPVSSELRDLAASSFELVRDSIQDGPAELKVDGGLTQGRGGYNVLTDA